MAINKLAAFFLCTNIVGGAGVGGVYMGITNAEPLQIICAMALGAVLGGGLVGLSFVAYYVSLKFSQRQKSSLGNSVALNGLRIQNHPLGSLEKPSPPLVIESSRSGDFINSLTLTRITDAVSETAESKITEPKIAESKKPSLHGRAYSY